MTKKLSIDKLLLSPIIAFSPEKHMIEVFDRDSWVNLAGDIPDFDTTENSLQAAKLPSLTRRDKRIFGAAGITSAMSLVGLMYDHGLNRVMENVRTGHAWDIFQGNLQAPFEYTTLYTSTYTTQSAQIANVCMGSSVTPVGSLLDKPISMTCYPISILGNPVNHVLETINTHMLPLWQQVSALAFVVAAGTLLLSPLFMRGKGEKMLQAIGLGNKTKTLV